MLTVHHLQNSRSQRIVWLLEELGLDYAVDYHERVDHLFAPPAYQALHGLGKAPILTDGDRVIAESGAIVEYLLEVHGEGRMRPPVGSDDWVRYLQFMHLIEGSVMPPFITGIYVEMLGAGGEPVRPRISGQIDHHFGYLERELAGRDFVVGDALTGADIQTNFAIEAAAMRHMLEPYPELRRYMGQMQARPAYARAVERGGASTSQDMRKAWRGEQ